MHQVDNIAFFMTFQENSVGVHNKSFRSSRIRVASPADSHVTFRGSVSTEELTKIGKPEKNKQTNKLIAYQERSKVFTCLLLTSY